MQQMEPRLGALKCDPSLEYHGRCQEKVLRGKVRVIVRGCWLVQYILLFKKGALFPLFSIVFFCFHLLGWIFGFRRFDLIVS